MFLILLKKNIIEWLKIDGLLSWLSSKKEIKGLKDYAPEDRPPVILTFISFRLMFAIGVFLFVLAIVAIIKFKTIEKAHSYLIKIFIYAIPLPYIATQLGWIIAEVGRQPWMVYNIM